MHDTVTGIKVSPVDFAPVHVTPLKSLWQVNCADDCHSNKTDLAWGIAYWPNKNSLPQASHSVSKTKRHCDPPLPPPLYIYKFYQSFEINVFWFRVLTQSKATVGSPVPLTNSCLTSLLKLSYSYSHACLFCGIVLCGWRDLKIQELTQVQCCFTFTETVRRGMLGTGSPGLPPWLSHSSWALRN